jgi:hypothetical protein
MTCPLCTQAGAEFYVEDKFRRYYQCSNCQLVFVPPQFFLSPAQEKAEYDLHENSPDDPRYRQFLSRLFEPMNNRLAPNSHGLDFGSGPGPTLSLLFEEAGHRMTIFDPFYAKDPSVFLSNYDFITATEVFEHLHFPKREIFRLWNGLTLDGILGIMTKLVSSRDAFVNWHYKNDPTHVCFYSRPTFEWLAHQLSADLLFIGNDVILLVKEKRAVSGVALCA